MTVETQPRNLDPEEIEAIREGAKSLVPGDENNQNAVLMRNDVAQDILKEVKGNLSVEAAIGKVAEERSLAQKSEIPQG